MYLVKGIHKMSSCFALTQTGARCRGFAEIVTETDDVIEYSVTCAKHRNYFADKTKWIKNLRKTARDLEYYPAKRIHIESILQCGVITLQKEDIMMLKGKKDGVNNNYTYFILCCARYVEGFHRDWNPDVFDDSMKTLWIIYGSIGYVTIKMDDFINMIRCSSLTLALSYISLPVVYSAAVTKFFDKFFLTNFGQQYFYLQSAKEDIEQLLSWVLINISEAASITIRKYIEKNRKQFYDAKKKDIQPIFQELIETTWHPSRVFDWCFEECEKRFINSSESELMEMVTSF